MCYVALLRGINVGGKTKVEMVKLREMFEALGFSNVKTLLNSGNVVFESQEESIAELSSQIERELEKTFGFTVAVVVRTHGDILHLVQSEPFMNIPVTPEIRRYVTFFDGQPETTVTIPYESKEKDFRILSVADGVVCSVLTVSPKRGSTDLMSLIEKEFSPKGNVTKRITTRNWNTVLKIFTLLG